jgi:hypothetical protein
MRKILFLAAAGWIARRVSSQIWPYAYPYSGRAILDLPRPLRLDGSVPSPLRERV